MLAKTNDNLLSLADIAAYIGVSKDTIRNWIKNTDMHAHKLGRLRKCKKSEIDKWISEKDKNRYDRA